MLGVLSQPVKL